MTTGRSVLVLAFFLVLAVVKTFPLVQHFGTHVPSDPGDPLLNTWILAWDVHALAHDPRRLFDANIAYPLDKTLAFSEHLLGALPTFAPVYLLTGNPVAGANTVFLLSFALTGFAGFWLCHYWTAELWPSLVAGALLGFAPARFAQISHLQLLSFFWAPVAFVFLDRFLRTLGWRWLVGFAICYWLQVLSSVYLALMLTVGVVAYVVCHLMMAGRNALTRALLVRAAVFAAASVVVLFPVERPYLAVNRAWDAARTAGGMAGYSASAVRYLAVPPMMNDAYRSLFAFAGPYAGNETHLFPGLVLVTLALIGAVASVAGIPAERVRRLRRIFGVVLLTAVVLSFGPYLVAGSMRTPLPLPYLALHHLVPGWSGMRVPARFVFLALLAAVPLAALGLLKICNVARMRWRVGPAMTSVAVLALFLVELGAKPLPLAAVPAVAPVYRWLATARPGPLLELPLETSGDQRYVYLSTVHWQPLVNGRSGFVPPPLERLAATLGTFPAPRAFEYARVLGVRAIVVHGDRLDTERQERIALEEAAGRLRVAARFGPDVVYAVPPVDAGGDLHAEISVPRSLPAGRDSRLGLVMTARDGRAWRDAGPYGLSSVRVEWRKDGGGSTTARARAELPLVVGSGEVAGVPLRVRVPTAPGRYVLDVSIPDRQIIVSSPIVVQGDRIPTSAEAPAAVAAVYELVKPAPTTARRGSVVLLDVQAINTGRAIWLARATHNRGEVGLRWQWLDASATSDASAASLAGGGPIKIHYEVFPGQAYRFQAAPETPLRAGRYRLRLGLESDGFASFAALGTAPLELAITVAE